MLLQEKGFKRSGHAAYGATKLAMNMLTYTLARKMEATSITVNCIDPGTVNTKLCYAGWGPVSHVALQLEVREGRGPVWQVWPGLAARAGVLCAMRL